MTWREEATVVREKRKYKRGEQNQTTEHREKRKKLGELYQKYPNLDLKQNDRKDQD